MPRTCSVCGGAQLEPVGIRADGVRVLLCSQCGVGCLENPPSAATAAGDFESTGGHATQLRPRSGHPIYSAPSLAWLPGLVELVLQPASVLDIGCGDGSFLEQWGPRWRRFGIEADPLLAAASARLGIQMVSNDILDPLARRRLPDDLQVILALGVLEHLRSFTEGVSWIVDLLAEDGMFLFEVPLLQIQGTHERPIDTHVEWYPTRTSLEWLVERNLGFHLAGIEYEVPGVGPMYLGIVAKQVEMAESARDLTARVLSGPIDALHDPAERSVRAQFQILHTADSGDAAEALLSLLPASDRSPQRVGSSGDAPDAGQAKLTETLESIHDVLVESQRTMRDGRDQDARLLAGISRRLDRIERALRAVEDREGAIVAEVSRGIERSERVRRDGFVRRTARLRRAVWMLLTSLARRERLRDVRWGFHVLASAAGRQVWSTMFDREDYLDSYPDVAKANVPPGLHYLLTGYREGRDPSRRFSTRAYLSAYPDVANAGINPLSHYAVLGRREGRKTYRAETPGRRLSEPPVAALTRANTRWPPDRPMVSVVIPCFNYGRRLRTAIDSVLAQTWTDYEVIVVEGGSTVADSVAAVHELEAEGPPRTRFFFRDERRLAGDNRNYGIERASGRYIVCLDPDDQVEPIYLEVALFLAEAFGYDVVYPSVQCFGDFRCVVAGRRYHVRRLARGERDLDRRSLSPQCLVGGRRFPRLGSGGCPCPGGLGILDQARWHGLSIEVDPQAAHAIPRTQRRPHFHVDGQ